MDDSKKTIVDGKETGGVTKSGNNVHNAQGQFGTKNEGSSSDLSSGLKRASKLTANISDLSNLFAKKAQFNESSMNIMNDIYKKYEQSNLLSIAKTAKSYYCGSSYSFYLNGCLREANFGAQVQNLSKLSSNDWRVISMLDNIISRNESKVGKRVTVTRRVDNDYFGFMSDKVKDETLRELSSSASIHDYSSMQRLSDYINENYIGFKNIDEGFSSVNFEEKQAYGGFRSRICTLNIDLKPDDHIFATGYERESEGILGRGNGMIFKEASVIQEGSYYKLKIRCGYEDPVNRRAGMLNG